MPPIGIDQFVRSWGKSAAGAPLETSDVEPRPKRRIAFVLTSKIHYSRSKLILAELRARPDVELQIIVGASAILKQYGDVEAWLAADGFPVAARITMNLEGGSNVAMAKTAGIGILEFASTFENLQPDLVVLRGDRYEVLSAAVAAAYMNCPIAHIEGGDVTGSIDESVRHAITKLSQIHLCTNDAARERIVRMGERPEYVFNVGAPDVEFAASVTDTITNEEIAAIGVGGTIDLAKEYMIVMHHPVTTEAGTNKEKTEILLDALLELRYPALLFWPNIDAGSNEVSEAIRRYRELRGVDSFMRFVRHLPPHKFIALLKNARCLVGNSSAGIKECSYLGLPVVNIGTRQQGRTRAGNVVDVPHDKEAIKGAVVRQFARGKFPASQYYWKPDTSKRISEILAQGDLYVQKIFTD